MPKKVNETLREIASENEEIHLVFKEAVNEALWAGDALEVLMIVRAYVSSTIGFASAARSSGIPETSLHRMLSARGNPNIQNIIALLKTLDESYSKIKRTNDSAEVNRPLMDLSPPDYLAAGIHALRARDGACYTPMH